MRGRVPEEDGDNGKNKETSGWYEESLRRELQGDLPRSSCLSLGN
jgi:hypothetical protein